MARRKFGNRKKRYNRKPRYSHKPSVASRVHVFKRPGAVVNIDNTGVIGQNNGVQRLSTLCYGWDISNIAEADDANTMQFGISGNFQMRDVIESTDFTSLFDRYKIVKVVLKLMYQSNNSGQGAVANVGTGFLPILNYTFDADDATVPVSAEDVNRKAFSKQRILNGNLPFSWVCKPRVAKLMQNENLGVPAWSTEKSCYLDSTRTDVRHFGFKAWINNYPYGFDGNYSKLTIQPIYYLAMRDSQ